MPLRHRLPGREIHRHIQRQPTQREPPRACRYKRVETEHTEMDTQRCICLQTHSLQTRRGSVHISTITEHEYPDSQSSAGNRVTNSSRLVQDFPILPLKVLCPGNPLSPRQTRTVCHPNTETRKTHRCLYTRRHRHTWAGTPSHTQSRETQGRQTHPSPPQRPSAHRHTPRYKHTRAGTCVHAHTHTHTHPYRTKEMPKLKPLKQRPSKFKEEQKQPLNQWANRTWALL